MDINPLLNLVRSSDWRTLILVRGQTEFVSGNFDYPYDQTSSRDAVESLFEESFTAMSSPRQTLFTIEELPIIQHLGKWKITIVTKDASGNVIMKDGTSSNTDGYMGVEKL